MEDYKKIIEQMITDGAVSQEVIEKYCPELQESEDEKIRKEMIEILRKEAHDFPSSVIAEKSNSWIAWLEKQQGEISDRIVERARTEKQRVLVTESNGVANIDWDTRSLQDAKSLMEYGLNYIKKELEKQGKQSPLQTNERAWLYLVADVLTWKDGIGQYLDDPRVQILAKKLCNEYAQRLYDSSVIPQNEKISFPTFTFDDILALHCCMETAKKVQEDKDLYEKLKDLHSRVHDAYLLEKQGEQKSINYSKQYADYHKDSELQMPRLTEFENELASILFNREYKGSTETDDDIARGRLEYELAAIRLSPKLISIALKEQKEIPNSEQKPTDEVKPKFRVGDWIISHYNHVAYIKSIEDKNYFLSCSDGNSERLSIDYINRNWRLWTIQDVKDGDVLKEDSCIFIIEKMNSNGSAKVHCCLFDDGEFDLTGSTLEFDVDSTHPATKEQREQLKKAMAKEGYTFDFEKKDLKKIEQTTSDTKDDEIVEIPQGCHAVIEGNKVFIRKGEKVITKTAIDKNKELTDFESELYTVVSYFWQRYINGEEIDLYAFVKEFSHDLLQIANRSDEWNEDDEEVVEALNHYVKNLDLFFSGIKIGDKDIQSKEFREKVQHWLKSLKDKVQPRPNQGWSKEDETYLEHCITAVKNYYTDDKGEENPFREPILDFLKSLKERHAWKKSLATADLENSLCDIQDRYSDTSYEYRILGEAIEFIRCTEPQPHWKPSDEQMEFLWKYAE